MSSSVKNDKEISTSPSFVLILCFPSVLQSYTHPCPARKIINPSYFEFEKSTSGSIKRIRSSINSSRQRRSAVEDPYPYSPKLLVIIFQFPPLKTSPVSPTCGSPFLSMEHAFQ